MIYKLNGIKISITSQREINGVTYPQGSLLLRRDEWPALGIIEEDDTDLSASELLSIARADLTNSVQNHLNATAQACRYDSIHTACGWAGDFADATALRAWGAACWVRAGQIEAEVIAGTRAIPTDVELIAMLPVFAYS